MKISGSSEAYFKFWTSLQGRGENGGPHSKTVKVNFFQVRERLKLEIRWLFKWYILLNKLDIVIQKLANIEL